MWFRSGNNNNTAHSPTVEGEDVVDSAVNNIPTTDLQGVKANVSPSKFEKFRRSSLRQKALPGQKTPKSGHKRMKSPPLLLKKQLSSLSLKEIDEFEKIDEKHLTSDDPSDQKVTSHVARLNKNSAEETDKLPPISYMMSLSDPQHKVSQGKLLKNSDTKSKSEFPKKSERLTQDSTLIKIVKTNKNNVDDNDDDDERDDDVNSDTSENDDKKETNNSDRKPDSDRNTSHNAKEKILLIDPKYRNNRIEKSSSKTKIDMDKRENVKRSRSNRKISTITVDPYEEIKSLRNITTTTTSKDAKTKAKKSSRTGSNINLQTLVKFVLSNRKFLNTDDFALIRQRSISEAASSVMQVAATCKPMPIALKYPQDSMVAQTPKDHDPEAERNVVLVKKQSIKSSIYDNINDDNIKDNKDNKDNTNNSSDFSKPPPPFMISKEKKCNSRFQTTNSRRLSIGKIHRHSSDSSKSSGNYEDEAFYSCDEIDEQKLNNNNEDLILVPDEKKQKSLKSRMAAKINETTTNYRNRKAANKAAKNRKSFGGSASGAMDLYPKPPYYKQLSFERLHSTSIQRQPSDRRPDAVNLSIRSNGNTSALLNTSDLQSSYHGADSSNMGATAVAGIGGVGASTALSCSVGSGGPLITSNLSMGGSTSGGNASGGGISPAGVIGALNDLNAQDAIECNNARRERLHQQHQQNKSAPVSVNRSESYKERLSHKRNRSQRKTSDPSLTSRQK
uniref:Uncharacterized protein n=1 Tax=Glossina brevipalpis TaxID=37001 RepID=A0A1A9WDT8_9MUSC